MKTLSYNICLSNCNNLFNMKRTSLEHKVVMITDVEGHLNSTVGLLSTSEQETDGNQLCV